MLSNASPQATFLRLLPQVSWGGGEVSGRRAEVGVIEGARTAPGRERQGPVRPRLGEPVLPSPTQQAGSKQGRGLTGRNAREVPGATRWRRPEPGLESRLTFYPELPLQLSCYPDFSLLTTLTPLSALIVYFRVNAHPEKH